MQTRIRERKNVNFFIYNIKQRPYIFEPKFEYVDCTNVAINNSKTLDMTHTHQPSPLTGL